MSPQNGAHSPETVPPYYTSESVLKEASHTSQGTNDLIKEMGTAH